MSELLAITKRQALLNLFNRLRVHIVTDNRYTLDGLFIDVDMVPFSTFITVSTPHYPGAMRITIGTTFFSEDGKEWPEDKPWVELWFHLHRDEDRLTFMRTEDGITFVLYWHNKAGQVFEDGFDPWVAHGRTACPAWKRILNAPDETFDIDLATEAMMYYLANSIAVEKP